jgi:hypothetical protein
MDIPRDQAEKLKRYLINADPFLWGILETNNKKARLKEIRALGFLSGYSEGSNPVYSKVNQDLLAELGIEGILERIVVPQVLKRLGKEVLHNFRLRWEQGQTPPKEYLKEKRLYRDHRFVWREKWEDKRIVASKEPAFIFVQINTQFDYVERWTVFAGLWFEEIEPLLGTMQESISKGSSAD